MKHENLHAPSFGTVFYFDALLFCLLVLATRAATGIHEIFGHAVFAKFGGAVVKAIHVSLLGGGKVWVLHPWDYGATAFFLFSMSGIALNLITGTLSLVFVWWRIRKKAPGILELFCALFSMASLLGGLAYFILGLYYENGDPMDWADPAPGWMFSLQVPLLLAVPVASAFSMRAFIRILSTVFPMETMGSRLHAAAATLGICVLLYAGLFYASGQSLASMDAPRLAGERARLRIMEQKRQALLRDLSRIHPDWPTERLLSALKDQQVRVDDSELPQKPPLIPVLALLMLAGTGAALLTKPENAFHAYNTFRPMVVPKAKILGVLIVGLLVLWVLASTGGVLYP